MPKTMVIALTGLIAATAGGGRQARLPFPDPDAGEASLEWRRTQQIESARALSVKHDFAFVDRLPESGISFEHRVVDDAASAYKAAHYDHGNGMPAGDIDGDGLPDLYFLNQIGGNELWRNLGAGKFENVTERAGVALPDRISVTGSFADIDNDGDVDLFVTTVRGGNALFENDGSGAFTEISARAGVDYSGHSSGAVFLDFDGDGLLDLFVTNVGSYTHEETGRGGYYLAREDAFHGHLYPDRFERSILYRNLGNHRFRDASADFGLVDDSWSGDASLVDFNDDGYADLYVLNMQGSDHYYENNQGRGFAERTSVLFPKTPWGAMGIGAFDYDNDGDFDLLLTDMHSDMNEEQAAEEEGRKQRFLEKYFYQERCCHILGNAFYRNDGVAPMMEVSDAMGLENFWPWGLSIGDVNADGWQDVFIASSMNYPFRYQTNTLRLNDAGRRFVAAEFLLGVEPRRDGRIRKPWFELDCAGADAEHIHCAAAEADALSVLGTLGTRSSVITDLDLDGDLDIVTAEFNSEPQVLISDLADRGDLNWLQVRLQGTASNRDGLGAKVIVEAGGRLYTRLHDGKSGYLTQSSLPLYFGLGDADRVDSIRVHWPSGTVQLLAGPLAVRRTLVIHESP